MAVQPQTPPLSTATASVPTVSPTQKHRPDNVAMAESPSKKAKLSQSSETSRLTAETVRIIAESQHRCSILNDSAAAVLASDSEYRIREIIQDSMKFMKHAKRGRLITEDINAALRLRNVAPTYGFGKTIAPVQLVQPARAPSGSEKSTSQFKNLLPDLYFTDFDAKSLKEHVEMALPPLPLEVTVASHWLAIGGVQPVIPQNPLPVYMEAPKDECVSTVADISKESSITNSVATNNNVRHVLSKELQLYFDHMVESLAGGDEARKKAVLTSISEEPGLLQLLPYFVQHVTNSVRLAVDKTRKDNESGNNLPVLVSSMRLVRALLSNSHFHIEAYLHTLLPVIITCVVGKRLFKKPRDNHWKLRDYAARILHDICNKYRDKYENVQTRISKTFMDAILNPKKSLTTHYGAIVGLSTLGKHVVDVTILPILGTYIQHIRAVLDVTAMKPKSIRRFEAVKVVGALCYALCTSATYKRPRDGTASGVPIFVPNMSNLTQTRFQDLPVDFRDLVEGLEKSTESSIYPHQANDSSFK